MSFLDTLRLNAGQLVENLGTGLGLPEYGKSEQLAGRNTMLTGKTPQSYSSMYPSYPASSFQSTTLPNNIKDNVNQSGTTDNNGNANQGNYNVNIPDPTEGYNRSLEAIRARLNEVKNQAGGIRNRATDTRNYIMEMVERQFPELIQRAERKQESSIGELDKEQTTMERLYAKAQAQARRRSEQQALKNRMSARAGNRLGSSFYDDIVAENQENLIGTLGEADVEKLDKVDSINTRKGETKQYFEDMIFDINTQKQQAERQAVEEYNQLTAQADALERAGVLDFGEAEESARQQLESKLSQISSWADNMARTASGLNQTYGQADTGINSFNYLNEALQSALGQNAGLTGVQTMTPTAMKTGGGIDQNVLAMLLGLRGNDKDKLIA